jgi:hypothetical protein
LLQTQNRQEQPQQFPSSAAATTVAAPAAQINATSTLTPIAVEEQGRQPVTSSRHLAELADFLRRHEEDEQQKCRERERQHQNEQQNRLLLHLIVELYNQLQVPYQQMILKLLQQQPALSKLTDHSSVAHDLVQQTCRIYNDLLLQANQNVAAFDTNLNPTASLTTALPPPPPLGTDAKEPFATISTPPVTATTAPTSPQQGSAMMHDNHAPMASRQLLQAHVDQIATLVQQPQSQHDPQQLHELDQHLLRLLVLARSSSNGQSLLLDSVPQSLETESTPSVATTLGSSSSTLGSVAKHTQPLAPAALLTESVNTTRATTPCSALLVQDRSAIQDVWQNSNLWMSRPNRQLPPNMDVCGHGGVDNSGIEYRQDATNNRNDDKTSDGRWLGSLVFQNDANDVTSVVAV